MPSVRFRTFAALKANLGQAEIVLDLPQTCRAVEALTALAAAHPAHAALLQRCRVASDTAFLAANDPLPAGILNLIPPVSGG
jgi:molybdopterin converting factor small subunit